ncbi:ABC transporter substrate-binding protein [Thermopolyspora sp. NPDC052614]|uniref:ABC transporter substrate-binding protein n=1 Tax=Thermopolyspora sp. NPDC052614 TaxID=3155682 RepID=UPI0034203F1D
MKFPNKRTGAVAALLLSAALAATGCAAQNTGGGTDTAAGGELKAAPGFDPKAKTITVGNIIALSGPISTTAREQLAGQQAWYDKVNAAGGIAGKYQIKMITADNQYDAQKSVQAYQEIKDQVVMLSGILGTPSVKALIPILNREKVAAVPSNQDASIRNDPALLPTFPSYQTNVVNAVSYLVSKKPELKNAKYCVLGYNSSWGDDVVQGLTYITGKFGNKVTSVAKYAPLDTQLTAQMQQLKSAGCEVVAFSGAANNLPSMVAAATQLDFKPQWIAEFIANSTAFSESPISSYLKDHVLFTGLGADLKGATVPAIKELRESKALNGADLTVQHIYGHIQAMAVTALLEEAVKDGDLSHEGVTKALAKLPKVEFNGINGEVILTPGARVLPKTTTIYEYDKEYSPYALKAVAENYAAPEGNDPAF